MRNQKTLLAVGACVMLFASCAGTSGESASGVSEEQCLKLDPAAPLEGHLEGATTSQFTTVTKHADGTTSQSRVTIERANGDLRATSLETTGEAGQSVTKYIVTPEAVYVKFPAGTLESVESTEWVRFTEQEPIGATMLEDVAAELNSNSVIPGESSLAEWISQTAEDLNIPAEASATFQSAGDACRFIIDDGSTQMSIAIDGEGRLEALEAKDSSDTEIKMSVGYKPVVITTPDEKELAPDTAVAAFMGKMNLASVETSALAFNRQVTVVAAQMSAMTGGTAGDRSNSTRNKIVIKEALGAQDGPQGVTIMVQGSDETSSPVVLWDGESFSSLALESMTSYPAYLQFVKNGASVCLRLSDDGSSAADTSDEGTKTGEVILPENISDGDTGAGWLIVRRVATGSKTTGDKVNACNGVKALTRTADGAWSAGATMTGW